MGIGNWLLEFSAAVTEYVAYSNPVTKLSVIVSCLMYMYTCIGMMCEYTVRTPADDR